MEAWSGRAAGVRSGRRECGAAGRRAERPAGGRSGRPAGGRSGRPAGARSGRLEGVSSRHPIPFRPVSAGPGGAGVKTALESGPVHSAVFPVRRPTRLEAGSGMGRNGAVASGEGVGARARARARRSGLALVAGESSDTCAGKLPDFWWERPDFCGELPVCGPRPSKCGLRRAERGPRPVARGPWPELLVHFEELYEELKERLQAELGVAVAKQRPAPGDAVRGLSRRPCLSSGQSWPCYWFGVGGLQQAGAHGLRKAATFMLVILVKLKCDVIHHRQHRRD